MNEVVINDIERTDFCGYCERHGKQCMHWEIEFPKSELEKLEPFVQEECELMFENEDGSVEEFICPSMTYVKNDKFIYNDRLCEIFSEIDFRTNERGEEVCYTFALFPIQN